MIRLKLVTEGQVAAALADQLGLPFVDLAVTAVESEAIQLIPERLARRHAILPVSIYQNVLQLAVADPLRLDAVEDARFAAGCALRLSIATVSDIKRAIDQHYHVSVSLDSLVKDLQGQWRHRGGSGRVRYPPRGSLRRCNRRWPVRSKRPRVSAQAIV